ncbi:MAG: SAM hydrolase/SAM-dependent halogenase family protein [Phycisphaeraceae bacterium]
MITLLTDFGLRDPYVGQMKGVIAGIAPEARVVDLTHLVPPQDLVAGAVALDAAVDAFEAGAVHVAVVDPGVGTQRRAIAVRTRDFFLVGPDNGIFTLVLDRHPARQIVRLSNRTYHYRAADGPASSTFHGRDVFAPAAAHLEAGVSIDALGEPMDKLVRLDLPRPKIGERAITAHVLAADHFGNLFTDLTAGQLVDWLGETARDAVELRVGDAVIRGISRTFADVEPGEPVAYVGSGGRLEIAVRNGHAEDALDAGPGAAVHLARPG